MEDGEDTAGGLVGVTHAPHRAPGPVGPVGLAGPVLEGGLVTGACGEGTVERTSQSGRHVERCESPTLVGDLVVVQPLPKLGDQEALVVAAAVDAAEVADLPQG